MLLRTCAAIGVALAVGITLAQAQAPAPAPNADDAHQRDQELESIRAEQQKALDRQNKLRDEIATLSEDRRKLNQALIDTAAGIRADEDKIATTEARLAQLATNEAVIRKSLDDRRAVIVEVLAALQRMGRRPPPAMLARPEDALDALRAAMLLGAIVPGMRSEAEALAAQLGDLVRVRATAAGERDGLARDLAGLSFRQNRMTLLIDERHKRQNEAETKLDAEHQRADELARQAGNLTDLIAKLEHAQPGGDHAAHGAPAGAPAAAAPGEPRPNLTALKDPGRLEPAIAFASAKGLLPLPVNGVRSREFGSPDRNGGTEKGISIATRPGAQITAPCDGWVVYAAPYRSYGQLLILNAGGGYHVVLAGMERISVDIGQFVLTGEPIAAMGSAPRVASTMGGASGASQPVLYIEFRKDGTPVDPNPWWATPGSEKVRG